MKLQPALIFGEHMVLQRGKEIRIWGRSCDEDRVTVKLHDQVKTAYCRHGDWSVVFEPEEANEKTVLEISSSLTGEKICFEDVAIGEVWLGGGQSNMEFLMKYDYDFEETKRTRKDPLLRQFTYPQAAYAGFMELDPCKDTGFWRIWDREEDRKFFSAVPTYMGMVLREKLNVPVGIISCNWGGSPASAWTPKEVLKADPVFAPILAFHENASKDIDYPKYYAASDVRQPLPSKQQQDFNDRFMMGEDMSEFFKNFDPSKLPKMDFGPFMPGPRSTIRPGGLYENMLCKVAPYALRGFLWYQGEDDDARDWVDFYDSSMVALINSWRELWKEELPFYQIELAPFRGIGMTAAKRYHVMREKQAKAAASLKDVYDVCILDAGEEFNIHPRHKKMVGERLSHIVLKHSYGDESVTADCPRFVYCKRGKEEIVLQFTDVAQGLFVTSDLKPCLTVTSDHKVLDYEYECEGDSLILKGNFEGKDLKIDFLQMNYCIDPLYNSEGSPAYGFSVEV